MVKKKKNEEIKDEEVLSRIAENVKYLRKKVLKLKQEEMEHHGFNYRFFQDIESGKHFPTLKTLLKLSKVFRVDIEDLVSKKLSKDPLRREDDFRVLQLDIKFSPIVKFTVGHSEFSVQLNLLHSLDENINAILEKIPENDNFRFAFHDKVLKKSELRKVLKEYLPKLGAN